MILLADAPTWADSLAAVSALLAAGAAGVALLIARTANNTAQKANETAEKANQVAETVKAIEERRWHAELTPQFKVTCQAMPADRAELHIDLTGPLPLGQLDELTVTIRDDGRSHPSSVSVTQAEIDATIWGPYQFLPHIDGADETGRNAKVSGLPVGNGRPISLRRTGAPRWGVSEGWRQQYDGEPVRLMLHCVRSGYEPWAVPFEVDVTPAKVAE
jgi:hypothetical protein